MTAVCLCFSLHKFSVFGEVEWKEPKYVPVRGEKTRRDTRELALPGILTMHLIVPGHVT